QPDPPTARPQAPAPPRPAAQAAVTAPARPAQAPAGPAQTAARPVQTPARPVQPAAGDAGLQLHDLLWRSGLLSLLTLTGRGLAGLFLTPVAYIVGAAVIVPTSLFGYLAQVVGGQAFSM